MDMLEQSLDYQENVTVYDEAKEPKLVDDTGGKLGNNIHS